MFESLTHLQSVCYAHPISFLFRRLSCHNSNGLNHRLLLFPNLNSASSAHGSTSLTHSSGIVPLQQISTTASSILLHRKPLPTMALANANLSDTKTSTPKELRLFFSPAPLTNSHNPAVTNSGCCEQSPKRARHRPRMKCRSAALSYSAAKSSPAAITCVNRRRTQRGTPS